MNADGTFAVFIKCVDKLFRDRVLIIYNDIVSVKHGERVGADERFCCMNGMCESARLLLTDIINIRKVRGF